MTYFDLRVYFNCNCIT